MQNRKRLFSRLILAFIMIVFLAYFVSAISDTFVEKNTGKADSQIAECIVKTDVYEEKENEIVHQAKRAERETDLQEAEEPNVMPEDTVEIDEADYVVPETTEEVEVKQEATAAIPEPTVTEPPVDSVSEPTSADESVNITNQHNVDPLDVSEEEVLILAKVIWFEAGSSWLSTEWKMSVGEVVLNRVASPEFPNTITEVVYAPGQYACIWRSDWDTKTFSEDDECMQIARRLIAGERIMEPSVVFQSGVVQGSGIYKSYYDSYFGTTYFCHSSYMENYQ